MFPLNTLLLTEPCERRYSLGLNRGSALTSEMFGYHSVFYVLFPRVGMLFGRLMILRVCLFVSSRVSQTLEVFHPSREGNETAESLVSRLSGLLVCGAVRFRIIK